MIAATNRPDVLDPALLRSGRLDRKIELPHPSEEARGRIMQIHSRKMNVDKSECDALLMGAPFIFAYGGPAWSLSGGGQWARARAGGLHQSR